MQHQYYVRHQSGFFMRGFNLFPLNPSLSYGYDSNMLSGIATMKIVKADTSIPVPHVLAHAASLSNELGYPSS
jgi:hypothetical protein